jgi:pseudouridine-5'-phosphate glycosidase
MPYRGRWTGPSGGGVVRVAPEVADAVAEGRPVVALESTLLTHGLPTPENREIASDIEEIVRAGGAVPATTAVLGGVAHVGLTPAELDRVCGAGMAKLSARDLGPAITLAVDGATTVASTCVLAERAGIDVFATGGLGGVHRGAERSWDVSADLATVAATPVLVVCSGVKSLLDVPATLEVLESLSVPVLSFGTHAFPGFYRRDSGRPSPWRVDSAEQVALALATHRALGSRAGMLLANPVPAEAELDRDLHDRVLAEALELANRRGTVGPDVTPLMLEHFHRATGGASLVCNIALVRANVALAARVAREVCATAR